MKNPKILPLEENYFLPPNYVARKISTTLEDDLDAGSYWNDDRLESSLRYQFDVYRIAYQLASKLKGASILDVGCGPAAKHNLFADLAPDASLTLVDQPTVESLAMNYCPNAQFYSTNLEETALDLKTKFDIVICADVVEHLLNPDPCLTFIRAHLKPGGVAFISTPERDRLYGPNKLTSGHACHVREWNQREFASFLSSRNFAIQKHIILHQQPTGFSRKIIDPALDRLGKFVPSYSCQLATCTADAFS